MCIFFKLQVETSTVSVGRKKNPRAAVQRAESALSCRTGAARVGRTKAVVRASVMGKVKQMIMELIHQQEEAARCVMTASQAKQWKNWERDKETWPEGVAGCGAKPH